MNPNFIALVIGGLAVAVIVGVWIDRQEVELPTALAAIVLAVMTYFVFLVASAILWSMR